MLLCALLKTVTVVFIHEQFRSCQSKSVYALFYVTYHKHIRCLYRLPGYTCQNKLLNIVTVLILIRHYLLIILPKFFCNLTWNNLAVFIFICQYCQCKMFHVVKIYYSIVPFSLCKCINKIYCQIYEFLYGRSHFI